MWKLRFLCCTVMSARRLSSSRAKALLWATLLGEVPCKEGSELITHSLCPTSGIITNRTCTSCLSSKGLRIALTVRDERVEETPSQPSCRCSWTLDPGRDRQVSCMGIGADHQRFVVYNLALLWSQVYPASVPVKQSPLQSGPSNSDISNSCWYRTVWTPP